MWETIFKVVNLAFQLFMVFIVVYSLLTVFALLRFGQSRILAFLVSLFYIMLISSLYFQTMSIIGGN